MTYAKNYTDNGAYYTFTFENGGEMYIPKSSVIFVNDESGCVSVKNIASRKTMFLIKQ